MQFYIDHAPGLFTSPDVLQTTKDAYARFVHVLLVSNYDFAVFKTQVQERTGAATVTTDGIFYATHTTSPGANSYCFKPGGLPYLWFIDPGGYSGWCELARNPALQDHSAGFPLDRAQAVVSHHRRQLRDENLSCIVQPDGVDDLDLDALGDYVFYPLQTNADDVLLLARFPQFKILRTLAALAASYQQHMVIKRHPLCKSPTITSALEELAGNPFVHVSAGSVNTLIDRCISVVVTNSSVGLQALIHGKPVISVGGSEYAHMTQQIHALADLKQAFTPPTGPQPERIVRQLGYLLDEYLVDMLDQDRIVRRVAEHVAIFQKTRPKSDDETASLVTEADRANVSIVLARDLERQTRDRVDFLLASYFLQDGEQRKPTVVALARLARATTEESLLARIVAGTDLAVSGRCMRLHIRDEQWDKAEELARILVSTRPPGAAACLRILAEALFKRGDKTWLKHARQAVRLPSADATHHLFLARRLLKGSRPITPEVRRAVATALELAPDNAQAHWLAARIADRDGDRDTARAEMAVACEYDPLNDTFRRYVEKLGAANHAHSSNKA